MKTPNATVISSRIQIDCETHTHAMQVLVHFRDLERFAERVARLNRDAGEMGAGMLATLVDEARRLTA